MPISCSKNSQTRPVERTCTKPSRISMAGISTLAVALCTAVVGSFGSGAATAAPPIVAVQIPVVTGPELPPASVPGGLFQMVTVTATTTDKPGVNTFAVPDPAPYYYMYSYRYLTVDWRNLQTGASGSVDLRHWVDESDIDPATFPNELYALTLPTRATVDTGPGPVVAAVSHRLTQWKSPPITNSVFPGALLLVP